MATPEEWSKAFARQADADLRTFLILQPLEIPECHKLQFLQMACEKLTKAPLCRQGADPVKLQSSHGYIAETMPKVLEIQIRSRNYTKAAARKVGGYIRQLCGEINLLAPAVKRGGKRPDNCEYPWTNGKGNLHVPLDWPFSPSDLLLRPGGRRFLKLVEYAIQRLL